MSNTSTTSTTPKTLAWVNARAREAGAREATPRVVETVTAHLARWKTLITAAVVVAEARLAAESAEKIPYPPVYRSADDYRSATLRHAAQGAVRGVWSPTEKMAFGVTPDEVLAEWGITRADVAAATR